jgi:gliding motility-associated transport system ATP-binding protein
MGRCPLIEVQGLTKHYEGRSAIVDLTFSVPRGEVLGLLGPDGAGKSTTLRIISGCLSPTAGTATVAGCDVVTRSREARRRLGYLAQGAPLHGDLRVASHLDTVCRLHGIRRSERRSRVDETLAACGLGDLRREIVGRLSPDSRRRLGLALAVVHGPEVLILDEPAAELDPAAAGEMRRLLAELARGRTVVMASRDLDEVDALCDRALVLERGRRVADPSPAELANRLRRRPRREVVAVVRGERAQVERHLRRAAGVAEVTVTDLEGGRLRVVVTGDGDDLQDAAARVILQQGFRLEELSSREPPSEDGS